MGASVLNGAAGCFFNPAFMRWRQAVIAPEARQRTYGTLSSARQMTMLVGPIVAGAVVGFGGPAIGFAVNAVTFLASLVTVLACASSLPLRGRTPKQRSSFRFAKDGRRCASAAGSSRA